MWPFKSKSKPTPGPLPAAVQQLARSQVVRLYSVEAHRGDRRARINLDTRIGSEYLSIWFDASPELAQHLGAKVRVTLEPVED